MKIRDLLKEQIQTTVRKRTSNNVWGTAAGESKRNLAMYDKNAGWSGHVIPGNDPHVVRKRNFVAQKENSDGYFTYIKDIADNNIASGNPYAPRVYKVDSIVDADGYSRYDIEIETLQRTDSISEDSIVLAVAKRLFNEMQLDAARNTLAGSSRLNGVSPSMVLARAIELTIQQKIVSNDSKLNSLCDRINALAKKHKFTLDVHAANIMFRLGAAPQVVIVDPLSDTDTSSKSGSFKY
jgi:hypothetical protein